MKMHAARQPTILASFSNDVWLTSVARLKKRRQIFFGIPLDPIQQIALCLQGLFFATVRSCAQSLSSTATRRFFVEFYSQIIGRCDRSQAPQTQVLKLVPRAPVSRSTPPQRPCTSTRLDFKPSSQIDPPGA